MRILRNVLLMVLPILLLVNIYRFTMSANGLLSNDEVFKGFNYFRTYIGTFPGISSTMNMFDFISNTGTTLSNTSVENLSDLIEVMKSFFQMVGGVLSIPVLLCIDIVNNVLWVFYGLFSL